jgi:ABC-type lipoprotein release transport system permease subunit
LQAVTVKVDMVLLSLALNSITEDTNVSLGLAVMVGGIIIGAAVMRALQGETQKRHADRIGELEEVIKTSPPSANAEDIKEIKAWKQEVIRQLHEFEIHRAVQDERSSGISTVRGARPKTGPRRKVDPT